MRCDQASEKEASAIPALWDTPECVGHPSVTKVQPYPLGWAREKALGTEFPPGNPEQEFLWSCSSEASPGDCGFELSASQSWSANV